MKKISFITALWIFWANLLFGQQLPAIIIEGQTKDSAFIKNPKNNQILILSTLSTASSVIESPRKIDKYILNASQPFKHIIHPIGKFTYVGFSVSRIKYYENSWSDMDNVYILEPGDQIKSKLSGYEYFEFSGKGAEKLNCQSAIYQHRIRGNTEEERKLLKANNYKDYYLSRGRRADSVLQLQLKIVNDYSPVLGKQMTEILYANCYGMRYFLGLWDQIGLTLPNKLNGFLEGEYKNIDFKINREVSEEALVAAPIYTNAILFKIFIDHLKNQDNQTQSKYSKKVTDAVYNDIITKYSGVIRQKLLNLYFYRFQNSMFLANHFANAEQYMKRKDFKEDFLEFKQIKTKGMPFYPFELEDDKGRIIKLSDLEKNVVVLDFWFSGCLACIELHRNMKPVIEKYKNNQKVKFVTISIDQKKLWKESIATGKYTDANYINLYTGGQGSKHPVIEKNQIDGYPALYIIKNGKLFSSTPPRPGPPNETEINEQTKMFIAMVEEALAEKEYIKAK